jgi:hypothetical protein
MYINYGTKVVMKRVTQEVVESFCFNITMPVQVVRDLVERNFIHSGDYGFAGFNKIFAIRELRALGSIQPVGNTNCLNLGLREAKEMVEAVYAEGVEAGNYHTTRPLNHTDDTLPF